MITVNKCKLGRNACQMEGHAVYLQFVDAASRSEETCSLNIESRVSGWGCLDITNNNIDIIVTVIIVIIIIIFNLSIIFIIYIQNEYENRCREK